jgi:RNA-directed DNA polymerase
MVSHNFPALSAFHQEVERIWRRCLRRRIQKAKRMHWDRFKAVLERFPLPEPSITHPWTESAA